MRALTIRTALLVGLALLRVNSDRSYGEDDFPFGKDHRYRYTMRQIYLYEPVALAAPDAPQNPHGVLELHSRETREAIATLDMQIWGPLDSKAFNPHRHTLTQESYNIAFFDQDKNHVGNLYPEKTVGSFRPPGPDDWVKLHQGGGIFTRILVKSRRISRPWKHDKIVLPAGKYEIQVIANSMMFAFPPLDLNGKFDEDLAEKWPKGRVIEDAWRSNKVSIVITEDDPVEPPK